MILYLAGGINGNLKKQWIELAKVIDKGGQAMDLYLAGSNGRRWIVDQAIQNQLKESNDDDMDIYLAGTKSFRENYEDKIIKFDVAILESFFYVDEWVEKIIPHLDRFLLDSGAFTFFTSGKHVDWLDYLDRYAKFIVKNDVKLFFELDIDSLVGYKKVLEFRKILERKTGRKCIPVWHKSRGLEEYFKMCEEYPYVAIGGIVSQEIKRTEYHVFPYLINEAHKRGAKVHGLGFTNLKGLELYKFDSVDSTSWTTGNRFGSIYQFNGRTMVKYVKKQGQRLSDPVKSAIHNFNEWVKFQRYAKTNL